MLNDRKKKKKSNLRKNSEKLDGVRRILMETQQDINKRKSEASGSENNFQTHFFN